MGITDSNPYSAGVMGAVKGALGLFKDINKTPSVGDQSVTQADEYESSYSEEKILGLVKSWRDIYQRYYADIESTQDTAYAYWLSKQKTDSVDTLEGRDVVDNLIFESLETFLPIATRANPDPLVTSDTSPEGMALAKDVKDALVDLADRQKFRMKLKSLTRNWALMRIGVIEVSYDYEIDEIKTDVINSKRILLDPKGHIDEAGHFVGGDWIGVRYNFSASTLAEMFPSKQKEVTQKSGQKKGTQMEIIKWWYKGTDIFFTLDEIVLAKKKNPHWNYDSVETRMDVETGAEIEEVTQGTNHLTRPAAPFVFLSVFKTGIQPHDETSLILQNIGIQDNINKRYRQLDKNIDSQNNGIIVNGQMMTQEQAAEAASAMRRGASIRVNGDPRTAFLRPEIPQLGSDVWNSLRDNREQLKNIFGISGATPSGVASEDTARGKILVNQLDSTRIGGGITEYIEQCADSVYNLWVQMMFVHYDNEHYVNALGMEQGGEMIMLKNTRFTKSLVITVKEGSLIPKDPLTQRNEAVDLWSQQAIDPITLYKKLDYPDPQGAAKQLLTWMLVKEGALPPQAYIPDFMGPPMGAPPAPDGTGTQAVNAPTGQDVADGSQPSIPEGAQAESKELIQSVPLK